MFAGFAVRGAAIGLLVTAMAMVAGTGITGTTGIIGENPPDLNSRNRRVGSCSRRKRPYGGSVFPEHALEASGLARLTCKQVHIKEVERDERSTSCRIRSRNFRSALPSKDKVRRRLFTRESCP